MITSCQCPSCTDTPLPTYTAGYMMDCEIKTVLGWRDRAKQEDFLKLVGVKRGIVAEKALRDALNFESKKEKSK